MAEDFSLSASLNIQRVDVRKVREEIKKLSNEGISIPITLDSDTIKKSIPQNFEVNLVIKNAPAIKKQMEKIFSVSSVIEGLGAVVKAEVDAIKKVAADALRDNQAKLDPNAIKKQALKNATNPKRLKAGAGGDFDRVDFNSVKQNNQKRNALQQQADKTMLENARKSASDLKNEYTTQAGEILNFFDRINNAAGQRGSVRAKQGGPFIFYQQVLKDILKINGATKEQLDERKRLQDELEKSLAEEERLTKNVGLPANSVKRIKQKGITTDLKAKISVIDSEIEVRTIGDLDNAVQRFAGSSGQSARNIQSSMEKVFISLSKLEDLRNRYDESGLLTGTAAEVEKLKKEIKELEDERAKIASSTAKKDVNRVKTIDSTIEDKQDRIKDKDINPLEKRLNKIREQILSLFTNIDTADITTLTQRINEEFLNPLEREFKDIKNAAQEFNREIGKLQERRGAALVSSSGDDGTELVKNLDRQIEILERVRNQGKTKLQDFVAADANSDRELAALKERAKQLEVLEQRANAADIALEKIVEVRVNRSLNQTEAAGYLDTMGKIEEVAIGTATAIDKIRFGGKGGRDEIAQVAVLSSQAEEQVRSLTDRTALLNNTLNTIDTSILKFDNQGLKSTVQAAGSLREEFIRLAQDGTIPLETLANTFNTELAKLDILKSAEDKLNKFNIQLDKVQQGFDAGAKSADKFGAKARLDQGRGELQVAFNANATEKEMELIVSSTTKAISAIEKLNSSYAGLAANFDKSAAKQSDAIGQKVFEDAGKAFAQYVDTIDTKGKTIDQIIKEITEAYTRFNVEAQRDIKLPPTIDKILETLSSKKAGFESKGQAKAADEIDRLVVSVSSLAATGADIQEIQKVFNRGLVNVDRINQDEKALEKYRISLDKLRASLDAPDAPTDFFKAAKTLQEGAATFDNVPNAGARKEELTSRLAGITAEVKARQRLNSTVDSLINKFGDLEAAQTRTAAGLTFRKAGADFQKTVQKIVSGGGDIQQQLRTIQSEFIRTRISASIEAEGGFLGSISKLAGLATKRLLAFVGIARLTFAIQSAFTEAVSAGLELEVQTNKLEQVFAKTFTTEESLINATNDVTDAIFKMSQEYGVAVGEVTKASRILAQAGFSGEALTKSLEAISKANLTATFNDINQTAEASIAVLNQFKLEADQLEAVLGGINRVSSLYAVESEGIAKAVRKAGGAFQAARGNISEFVGAFTILKKETREADEALATALRNISIRLQRTTIQNKVGGILGINFLDQQGQFIGVTESLGKISAKLKELNIASTDPRFAAVVESIAGARQFARLIPLLNQYDELGQIQEEFNKGAGSLDEDAARAMTTLNNKMEQLRSTFAELSNAVLTSDLFKNLVDGLNLVVKGLNKAVKLFGNMNVLLLTAASIALPKIITSGLAFNFLSGAGASPFGAAGRLFNRNSGGIIPGRGPNTDTVPAMLTRGEYVIQRDAVDKYGIGFFDKINAKKYNRGGRVGYNTGGGVGSGISNISGIIVAAFEKGSQKLIDAIDSFKRGGIVLNPDKIEQPNTSSLPMSFGRAKQIRPNRDPINDNRESFGTGLFAERSVGNYASFAQPKQSSGGGNQIAKLISSLSPVTPMLLKLTGGLGLGVTALSTFAHISEESSLSVNDWTVALGTGVATYLTTITLFKTLNGVLATANARLALANAKGAIGDFTRGLGGRSGPVNLNPGLGRPNSLPRAIGRSESLGRLAGKLPGSKALSSALSFAGKGLSRLGAGAAASGGVLVPLIAGFSALTVVSKSLGSIAAANAQELLNESKTREEAAAALDKLDFADRLSSGFGVFTKFNQALDYVGSGISNFGTGLYETIPGLQGLVGSISGLGAYLGSLLPEDQKTISQQSSRRSLSDARFDLEEVGESAKGLGSQDQAKRGEAAKTVQTGLANAAKNILSGISEGASAQGVSFAEFLKGSDSGKKAAEDLRDKLEVAVKNGVNIDPNVLSEIQKVFNIGDIKFDPKQIQRAVSAIDNMSLLFLRLETITEQATNRMIAVEGNLAGFDQSVSALTGEGFRFEIPSQVFDLIDKGIDPASLGLGQFSDRIKTALSNFNPAEGAAFNLEFGARELSRKLNEGIAATGDTIRFDPNIGGDEGGGGNPALAIENELTKRAKGTGASKAILDAYNDFVASRAAEIAETAGGGDGIFKLTAQEFTKINNEFADNLKKGAGENLRKRIQIESEFTNRYADLFAKRFELENKFIDTLGGVTDKYKAITEFNNKLKDPTSDGLTIRQAAGGDRQRLSNALSGTGLSGNSSVDDIRAAVQDTQIKLQGFATNRDPRTGKKLGLDDRQRQLGSQQGIQIQQRLTNALELMASGGEKGEAAMRAFEKASEQAKKSSEYFLDTLLGTDEELLNAGRATALFNEVLASGSAFQANRALGRADSSTRQALSGLLSSNDKMRADFNKAIGVNNPSQAGSPEATAVQSNLAEQLKAQKALAEMTQGQIRAMDGLTQALGAQEQGAVQMMTNQINQAAVIANDMTKNLANIPTEINHTHKVADINVNFIGAASLDRLQEGFKGVIINTIKEEIAKNNAHLKRANPNLSPF